MHGKSVGSWISIGPMYGIFRIGKELFFSHIDEILKSGIDIRSLREDTQLYPRETIEHRINMNNCEIDFTIITIEGERIPSHITYMREGQYREPLGKIEYPIFLGRFLIPSELKFPPGIIVQAKKIFEQEYLSFCAWIFI